MKKALTFSKKHTRITKQEYEIIMHSRKSLVFDEGSPWAKKNGNSLFDVTMGSYDGAEICELIGVHILNTLSRKFDKKNIGLSRDDGLAVIKSTSGVTAYRTWKDITKALRDLGLRITIDCNLKVTNFLDITLNLNNGEYSPYRKPNDRPVYIHRPPTTRLQSSRTYQPPSVDAYWTFHAI